MTTPSVAAGPPGNCAYPSNPPPRVQTHRFRYLEEGHAGAPPVEAFLTVSFVPKESRVVLVRVMPLVALPDGSFVASANRIFESTMSPRQTNGVRVLSALVAP